MSNGMVGHHPSRIAMNLDRIRQLMKESAMKSNRNLEKIRLVAVSKTKPSSDILEAYQFAGHRHFGENYVQELVSKSKELPSDIQWHFIGSLQRNKIGELAKIPNLFAIESVDTIQKANALNRHWEKRSSKLNIFLQVNTSGEESKSGIHPKECLNLVQQVLEQCPFLNLMGFMTIGAPDQPLNQVERNPDFVCLVDLARKTKEAFNIDLELSMGMSDDFQHAIECGSTNVRVGSLIFGSRK